MTLVDTKRYISVRITIEGRKEEKEYNMTDRIDVNYGDIGEDYIPKKGKFLFENTRVMLTYGKRDYETHINKEEFIAWANKLFEKKITFIRVAHESSNELHPYKHTHAVIQWEVAPRTTSPRKFDYIMPDDTIIHPNIKRIKTDLHFKRAQKYLGKEDKDNEDLYLMHVTWQENLQQCKTQMDVVKMAIAPTQIPGLLAAFNIQQNQIVKPPPFSPSTMLSRWQYKFYNRLNETSFCPPRDIIFKNNDASGEWNSDESFEETGDRRVGRKVIAVYNDLGNCGKTALIKKLMKYEPERFLCMQGVSKARDISTTIINAFEKGWNGDTILINLTRQAADHKIYNSIEMCIDGFITSEKWVGTTKCWDCKNIAIFTNFMPNIHAMSTDRWEVYSVRKINSELRPMSLKDCILKYKEETEIRNKSNFD